MDKYKYLFFIFLFFMTFSVYKFTFSFFSDSSSSTTNTFAAASVFPTPTPLFANHLVISEVQINGSNANQDFVEIYNPTSSPVPLTGWKINVRTSNGTESTLITIGAGKTIQANGFFLWSNDQGTYETEVGADVSSSANLSENNSVGLIDSTNNIIDRLGWGNGSNQFVEGTLYPVSPGSGKSLERKAFSGSTQATMEGGADSTKGNGFDGDNNSTDFITRNASQPQNTGSGTETP